MIAGVLRSRSHMWQMHSAAAGSFGAPILRRSLPKPHQQRQCYNRFPHSIQRKTRELDELRSSSNVLSSKIGLVSWYLGMVKSHPILTKSVTCAFIYAAADLSAQNFQTIVESSSVSYDFVRTLRMAGYGMLILGPSLHFWFNFVSKVLPKRDLFTTLKKIVMGQTLYGPVMTVVFFTTNAALQGENGAEIVARLKRDLLPTMINGVMYWPICDFITFKFIPVHLQPLVSNSFSYLWTVYITYMASLEKATSSS